FIFVVDPWMWLILGSSLVWLITGSNLRVLVWTIIWIILSLIMALALHEPSSRFPFTIPLAVRIIWFVGLAFIIYVALHDWGRFGAKLARFSLLALAIYYASMWMARQTAVEQVQNSLPADNVRSVAAWATPANPLVWQAVAATDEKVYSRFVNLTNSPS